MLPNVETQFRAVPHEKLVVAHVVKIFCAFCGT